MGASVGNNQSAGFTSEINITPLVDVVLVLLIIFMVIVPVMMRGHDVNVPGESVAGPADMERPEQIVLYIEEANCPVFEAPDGPGLPGECTVHLNDEPVDVRGLAGRVASLYEERNGEDRVLFLNARPALNYEQVMRILDAARSEIDDLKVGMLAEG